MQLLLELLDTATRETKEVKRMRPFLNKITQMLFKQDADWVKDKKRGPEAKYLGVVHETSLVNDGRGHPLKLTFDNSTDSGEFEINSLTPLMIEKGSSLDEDLHKLYEKHAVASKKKINYMSRDGKMVIREIHIGVNLTSAAVALVKEALAMFKTRLTEAKEKRCEKCGGIYDFHHAIIPPHKFVERVSESAQKYMDEKTWEKHAVAKGCTIKLSGGSAATRDRIWFAYDVHKKQVGYFYEEDREGSLN